MYVEHGQPCLQPEDELWAATLLAEWEHLASNRSLVAALYKLIRSRMFARIELNSDVTLVKGAPTDMFVLL